MTKSSLPLALSFSEKSTFIMMFLYKMFLKIYAFYIEYENIVALQGVGSLRGEP